MLTQILVFTLYTSLAIHMALIAVAVLYLLYGKSVADRLLSVELLTTLVLAVIVILALVTEQSLYMDIATVIAALSFIGTIAVAKYLADEQMY